MTTLLHGRAHEVLLHRPDPGTWSLLEYAAHVSEAIPWYVAAANGLDGTSPRCGSACGAASGEDPDGREVGATAVGARFPVVVELRQLIEDEEHFHVREMVGEAIAVTATLGRK